MRKDSGTPEEKDEREGAGRVSLKEALEAAAFEWEVDRPNGPAGYAGIRAYGPGGSPALYAGYRDGGPGEAEVWAAAEEDLAKGNAVVLFSGGDWPDRILKASSPAEAVLALLAASLPLESRARRIPGLKQRAAAHRR